MLPVVRPGLSDSATFDSVMELLVLSGRSIEHAAMMMVPAVWQDNPELPAELRDFYAYHSCLMEPWDGPAAIAFTDGTTVGATLDRNGLRPGRWVLTKGGDVLLASEAGVLGIREADIEVKGRLQPGKLLMVDLAAGRLHANREAERRVAVTTALRALVPRERGPARGPARAPAAGAAHRAAARAPARVRLHARRTCACCSRRWPATAPSRSARWATTSPSPCSPIASRRCSATSSSSSRR